MIEPSLMAAKALLALWGQESQTGRQPELAAQFIAARPGQYAGGHEILIEVLLRADKLTNAAHLAEAHLEDIGCLVMQALDIGSGSGAAIEGLQTRVQRTIAILVELGHGPAFHSAISSLQLLARQTHSAAKMLAVVNCTSVANYCHGQAALHRLKEVKQTCDRASLLAPAAQAQQTWNTIHLNLQARLVELGIDASPRQLMELQLRGNPSHLVQVLFHCGRIRPEHFR